MSDLINFLSSAQYRRRSGQKNDDGLSDPGIAVLQSSTYREAGLFPPFRPSPKDFIS
jgi:hypothetical protein